MPEPHTTTTHRQSTADSLFPSFFLAGFECATPINRHGERIDQIVATQHDRFVERDYAILRRRSIRAVREGVRWHLIDQGGRYDWQSLRPFVEAARRWDIVPIWDLWHYGYPEGLDIFSQEYVDRFADYCYAVATYVDRRMDGTPFFTPVNEISYFTWAAGDQALFAPHERERAWELKVILARSAIAAIDAIRSVNPDARIVNADPLCRVVAPADQPELHDEAENWNRHNVYQTWDMLAGRLLPELGGSRRHLDIVGLNYYWTNQWEHTRDCIPLPPDDSRLWPLHRLLLQVHERYGGDIMLTEAAHHGENRPAWMAELTGEVQKAIDAGANIGGICWYPVLGMPEWHEPEVYVPMGLWDLEQDEDGALRRTADPELMTALSQAQRDMSRFLAERQGVSVNGRAPEAATAGR